MDENQEFSEIARRFWSPRVRFRLVRRSAKVAARHFGNQPTRLGPFSSFSRFFEPLQLWLLVEYMEKLLRNEKFVRIGVFAVAVYPNQVPFGCPVLPEPILGRSVEAGSD